MKTAVHLKIIKTVNGRYRKYVRAVDLDTGEKYTVSVPLDARVDDGQLRMDIKAIVPGKYGITLVAEGVQIIKKGGQGDDVN